MLAQRSDGKISASQQGEKGDCWLIASVAGLAGFKTEIFNDCINVDENGNTTIKLKGPQKSYVITKAELDEAIKKQSYATGDRDMIAFELAFEKFRKENIENKKATHTNPLSMYAMGSYYDDDYNYGGLPRNAIEILTGKRVYSLATSSKENIYLEENIAKLGKLDEKRIKKIETIVHAMEQFSGQPVEYIDLRNPKDIYIKLPQVNVRLGELDYMALSRVRNISAILPQIKTLNKKIKYIDLRWEDTQYIKLEE